MDRDRRRVIQGLALLAGLNAIARDAQCQARRAPPMPSGPFVVRARRKTVVDANGIVNTAELRDQLGGAVARALGAATPVKAFQRLFRPNDVVGIKVNTLAGRGLSSRPELVMQLAGWLQQAGVRANNIVIWDRLDRELSAAGFVINRTSSGVRCFGTNDDYDWTPREWGPGGSCFARVLTSELTALINVGTLKDHDLAGLSAGLKNLYGVIHNPNKHHDNGCNPYVGYLAAYPLIKNKLRLTVIDGLVAQCHGGPARSPRWGWPWAGLLVSTDPVAADAIAWRVIDARRREVGLKSLAEDGREPKWIEVAAKLGVGESRLGRITVVDS